ncbi:PEP-CTERM domain protein [Nostoc sp. RF31YmG]|jgi:hypothetical protein|nr:PEP-CTERM domain protein [Nostoc sp. RF31YmG]
MNSKFFQTLATATTFAGIVATSGVANAASLTSSSSTGFGLTNIIDSPLSVQKFDASLGTLKSVKIEFAGDLLGTARFENLSPSSTPVTVNLASNLGLKLNNQSLFALNPQNSFNYQVGASDGTLDFGGTSGQSVTGLSASQSDTKTYTDSQFLQSFIGGGNLEFLFSALAQSGVTGSGNMISSITTEAKAAIKVTYDYDELKSVPEPSAALGLGLIAGIGMLSKSKKTRLKMSTF